MVPLTERSSSASDAPTAHPDERPAAQRQAVTGRRADGLVLHLVAALVTGLILAPLVLPGYVLAYDMVFVPKQTLSWELIAPADALPRAVPLDAVVALLSQLVPGWLVQRLALVSLVWAAAVGAGRLVPADRLATRVLAAVCYAWAPFLAERLLLGQWALLVAYAAMPWLVAAALGVRAGRPRSLARLLVAAAAAAITPTGGVIALAVTVVLLSGRYAHAARSFTIAVAGVVSLNAPWIVAALWTAAPARSDPTGVLAFAARSENWGGPLAALAGTGGMWNSLTMPASRASPLVPLATAVMVVVAGVGIVRLRRRWPERFTVRLGLLALGGFLVATAALLPPGRAVLAWLVVQVPGAGLLRDGQKFLIPYGLLLALGLSLGVEHLADRLAGRFGVATGRVLLAAAALLPVVLLPDLAVGAGGRLWPVRYPADWEVVRGYVDAAPGEVLSLPFEEYQSYRWNRGRVVIDPAPRYLSAPVLSDDTLRVGDLVVAGENPRAREVRALIAAAAPVRETGARWVLVRREPDQPVSPEVLAGLREVHDGSHLALYENPRWSPDRTPERPWPVYAAYLLAAAVLAAGFLALCRPRRPW